MLSDIQWHFKRAAADCTVVQLLSNRLATAATDSSTAPIPERDLDCRSGFVIWLTVLSKAHIGFIRSSMAARANVRVGDARQAYSDWPGLKEQKYP
jgi:hypothetical protein